MQRINPDEFIEGLKVEVSGSFPFRDGETLDDWVERAIQTLKPSQRAMLAARMGTVQDRFKAAYFSRKRAWIASARVQFEPSSRRACFVCGEFAPIAQAHHVVPLNEQYEHSFEVADHEHEWLCPNHHVTLHIMIDRSRSAQLLGRRAAPIIADLPVEHIRKLMELVRRSGRRAPFRANKVIAR